MTSSDDFIIGIDLGTSNSVACVYVDGKPTLIPSKEGLNLYGASFPSYVAFVDDETNIGEVEVLVGEPAKKKYVSNPEDVVRAVKKDMGKDIKREYKGKMYSPQQISGFILQKIKTDAETFLKKPVKNAIITVPAYFDDNQRTATKDAGEMVGLDVKLINEPTAASLAYGINNQREGLQKILVFDVGGGTLDVTIMQFGAGVFEVKATNGVNTGLGGIDMDNIISDYLVGEYEKQHGIKLKLNKRLKNRLIEASERAKIDLSTNYDTEVNLPYMGMSRDGNPLDLIVTISRSKLDELVRPIVERYSAPIQDALDEAGFSKNDITKLILVGGPTKMPIVRKYVQNYMGITAEEGIDPMACVAQGASIKGGVETGEIEIVNDIIDVIPLSLGIASKGRITEVLVERNTQVPITKSRKFRTVKNNQKFIRVEIVQGEYQMADENTPLGSFVMDVKPAPKGKITVEIKFEIDKNGILNVTAIDESTGNKKSLRLDSPNKLPESEIIRIMEEFKQNAAQDEERRILAQMKNKAYSIIFDAETLMDANYVGYSDKTNLEKLIKDLQNAIDDNQKTKIKIYTAKLNKAIAEIR